MNTHQTRRHTDPLGRITALRRGARLRAAGENLAVAPAAFPRVRPCSSRFARGAGLLLATALALFLAPRASAGWLSLQRSEGGGAAFRADYFDTAGGKRTLVVSDVRPGAGVPVLDLPFSANEVEWAGLLGTGVAGRLGKGLILQGAEAGGFLRVSEVIPLEEAPAPAGALPLEGDLLPVLRATPFGAEGRVTVRREEGCLVVTCRPGKAPAGIVFRADAGRLPEYARLRVAIAGSGSGRYEWAISDAARQAAESPLRLGSLQAAEAPQTVEMALPDEGLDRGRWASWSLICPAEGGRLELTSLKLLAESRRETPPGRAAWAWQPALWADTPDLLLARLRRVEVDTVYITVLQAPAGGSLLHADLLAAFIKRAGEAGIHVWAVTGDPRAVLPAQRGKFVQRARACAAYNRGVEPAARLAGIQYDIEPYLVPGFSLDPNAWHRAYLATLAALRAAADLPLEVAVPFWYARHEVDGTPLLDRLAPLVDSLAVMDYRTDPAQIRACAEPFLAWGARHGRRVRIGLESGPIGDEARRHYAPAPAGEVWLVSLEGKDVLLLLKHPRANASGPAFRQTRESRFSGGSISFQGREDALRALLPGLETYFGAWPSFGGLALHGLSYRENEEARPTVERLGGGK